MQVRLSWSDVFNSVTIGNNYFANVNQIAFPFQYSTASLDALSNLHEPLLPLRNLITGPEPI